MRVIIAAMLLLPLAAHAGDPTGPEVLAKVDEQLNAFKDAIFESKLLVRQPDGKAREYAFTTWQKVPDKRLVKFSAPGDVRGMGMLVENKETMYVYLPGFQKIRRLGTHVKNQSFMGSDVGFEDMSQTTFGAMYDAKMGAVEADKFVLDLEVKKGMDIEFPKMKMWVDKTKFVPLKMEFMDGGGKKLKSQIREDYKQDSPKHWQPMHITSIDHRRNDHTSEIVFSSTKLDTGLSDDLFTQRSLLRGN
jgi:outer membrane lipoprotein-sorting protein